MQPVFETNDGISGWLIEECVREESVSVSLKKGILIAVWLMVALVWLPLPKGDVKLMTVKNREKPSGITIKAKPLEVVTSPNLLEERRIVPMPDTTPMEPEILREPLDIPHPEMVIGEGSFVFDIPDPPAKSVPDIVAERAPGLILPQFTSRKIPSYPVKAAKIGVQGYVILEAVLMADGTIKDIKVLRDPGRGKLGFDDAALKALEKWTFIPGKMNGKSVNVRMTLKIDFQLAR